MSVRLRWFSVMGRPRAALPFPVLSHHGGHPIADFRHYDPHGESRDREAEFYLSQAIEHGTPEVVEAIVSYCPALVRPRIQHSEAIEEAGQQLRTAKDGEAEERARRILEVVEGAADKRPAPATEPGPEAGM